MRLFWRILEDSAQLSAFSAEGVHCFCRNFADKSQEQTIQHAYGTEVTKKQTKPQASGSQQLH